ncbi:replication protein A 70 kDa dna-binding subunit, partial [Trifolium medium]|nr:replication protein A 70 kDa dna-binding subunit [Trifolium medium]
MNAGVNAGANHAAFNANVRLHALHGRIKIGRDPSTRMLIFFKLMEEKVGGINTGNHCWVRFDILTGSLFNGNDEGSSNRPRNVSDQRLTVHMGPQTMNGGSVLQQEGVDNNLLTVIKNKSPLGPTINPSRMMLEGDSSSIPTEIAPKKRPRKDEVMLDKEEDNINKAANKEEMQVAARAGKDIIMQQNPLFDKGRGGGVAILWNNSLKCHITNYSLNHIDIEVVDEVRGNWRITGFYGFPEGGRRRASWNFLRQLSQTSQLPWCIIGDFNDILSSDEKRGRTDRPDWLIHGFRDAVADAGLIDIEMSGYPFTWFKSLGTSRAFVHQQWNSHADGTITQKLHNCANELSKWSAENCQRTRKDIEKFRRKLEVARNHVDETNIHYYNEIPKKLDFLLIKDDLFWKQRAKTFWYRDGDLNTRFYHAAASTRKKKNQIAQLQDSHGNVCNDPEGLKEIAKDYFLNLFQQHNGERSTVLNAVSPSISLEDNDALTAPFTLAEFKEAIFAMEGDKCPGPDGFNPGFYHHFWDLCGHEIFKAGCAWLDCRAFPPNLNSTNITLIPKGETQTTMKDWRPISLCNVLYKVVAKVLANRLKSVLDKCISENQSASVPGRSILDNAMAPIEIIHSMKSKTRGKKGEAALKLDISKAYDRIDWVFLKEMMAKMGFSQKWIDWIMLCVETVDYSVIVNGHMVGPIVPGRGLRQGDPLSPYLFIICAEGLSALIKQAEHKGELHGVKICRNAPIISHLLFADDCFLFFKATTNEANVMKNILSLYESASGQAINLQKSEFYCSRNVSAEVREAIASQLGVTQVLGTGKYLGLPSMIGRSKKSTFKFIKDRIWRKINSWSSRHLSQAGREVMIKSILQSIPTYVMSIFLIPSTLVEEIEKMLNSFWWGHNGRNGRGIHWLSWDRLSVSKDYGGMGFKSLQAFNLALLGKQAWNLVTRPDNLITKLLKARYFPKCDFLEANIGHNPSYVWRSIWRSKFIVQ